MITDFERNELAGIISNSGVGTQNCLALADALLAAGVRKPVVLKYVVVHQLGYTLDGQYDERSEAQGKADWLNSCRPESQTDEYRVAEIVEAVIVEPDNTPAAAPVAFP